MAKKLQTIEDKTDAEVFVINGNHDILSLIHIYFASISEIIGGSVLVEQVFSYPGIGQAAVAAGLGSDMPLLMAITIVTALFVFGGNMTANILYGLVDPRIRRGGAS